MIAWMLFSFVFSLNCDVEKQQFDTVHATVPEILQTTYGKRWTLDIDAALKYVKAIDQLRSCQKTNALELTPCAQSIPLEHPIGFGHMAVRPFEFFELGGQCVFEKQGLEYLIGAEGPVSYGMNELWSISPWADLYCASTDLGRTRRQWVASPSSSTSSPGVFVVDFHLPGQADLPSSLFWGRKMHFPKSSRLRIYGFSKQRIRFLWSNKAYVDIDTLSGAIADSNFMDRSMFNTSCVTNTESGHFIPRVKISSEGLGLVEKVEDIAH